MDRKLRILILLPILVLALAVDVLAHRPQALKLIPQIDRETFAFKPLPLLTGGTWSPRNRAAVVNLWATTCPPCRTETPALVRLSKQFPNVDFVGVNLDQGDPIVVQDFIRHNQIPYPIASGIAEPAIAPYTHLPVTYLLDSNAKIAYRIDGAINESSLRQTLLAFPNNQQPTTNQRN